MAKPNEVITRGVYSVTVVCVVSVIGGGGGEVVPTCKETCEVANIGPFVKRQCGTALDLLSILLNLRASLSQTTAYVNQHNPAGSM